MTAQVSFTAVVSKNIDADTSFMIQEWAWRASDIASSCEVEIKIWELHAFTSFCIEHWAFIASPHAWAGSEVEINIWKLHTITSAGIEVRAFITSPHAGASHSINDISIVVDAVTHIFRPVTRNTFQIFTADSNLVVVCYSPEDVLKYINATDPNKPRPPKNLIKKSRLAVSYLQKIYFKRYTDTVCTLKNQIGR